MHNLRMVKIKSYNSNGNDSNVLPSLKKLNLSNSMMLQGLPDLYNLSPNIEDVILSGCISLIHVYSSSFLNSTTLTGYV
ncbi:unnamed protein product [Trifolium pratense]|uniref:Uncharacterized protein n=1 Tax=Trifolium pratense TaxID=57577 RepID=A0ACB0M7W8_TRIPR|nr:unnamed protein product [Trifolium pratense]